MTSLPGVLLAAVLAQTSGSSPERDARERGAHREVKAEAAPRVALTSVSCAGFSAEEFRRIVAVELGPLLTDDVAVAAHRLSVSCEGHEARLRVSSREGQRVVMRTLDLAEFPADLVPRALALAGVELLAAESPTLRLHLEPPTAVVATAAAAPKTVTAPRAPVADRPIPFGTPPVALERPRWRLLVAPVRRSFLGEQGLHAWGGEVAVERASSGLWRLLLSLDGSATRATTELGEMRAWLASLAGFWGVGVRGGAWQGDLALGARAGLVDWAAVALPGAMSTGAIRPWLGPALKALVTAGNDRLGLFLQAEAGVTAVSAEALSNVRPVLRVSGLWLTWGAGLVFW